VSVRHSMRAQLARIASRLRGYPSSRWFVKRGLRLGRDVYIGEFTSFDQGFPWLISIGDEAVLSSNIRIVAHDGATKHWTGYVRVGRVHVGRRVYIGTGSVVLPGVTIGDGAVIGAGSVVTRDIPANTVAAGSPARPIATVSEWAEKHRDALENRPRYPRPGFSGWEYVTEQNADRMLHELSDGAGYVE
jgi:maltose O-acetyltransferase